MLSPPILVPSRHGIGSRATPWRWSGRFRLHDVNGKLTASAGAVGDIEADLLHLARACGVQAVLLRIMRAGRAQLDVPVVLATIQEGEMSVRCHMRGGKRWDLAHLLGMVLPAGALVTIEAWVKEESDLATIEQEEEEEAGMEHDFESFLTTLPLAGVFALRDVANGRRGPRAFHQINLIAQSYVARGILEADMDGKRRVFILRRPVRSPEQLRMGLTPWSRSQAVHPSDGGEPIGQEAFLHETND